jgi:hypothetical protein
MTKPIERADARSRRNTLILLGVLLLLGSVAITWGLPALESRLRADLDEVEAVVRLAVVTVLAPILLLAAYLLWFALRILSTGRYPPPGAQMLRDTVVRTGREARLWGYVLLGCSLLVALLDMAAILVALLI